MLTRKWLCRLALILYSTVSVSAQAEVEPSFDCSAASTTVERGICDQSSLAVLDKKLARTYKRVLDSDYEDKERLVTEQRKWLEGRDECVENDDRADASCLASMYDDRISELAALISHDSAAVEHDEPLEVLRVTPKGRDAEPARQVVVTFDKPVVAIGEMGVDEDEVPVTIEPSLPCEWRWLNVSSLSCRLDHDDRMKPATKYTIKVHEGIRTVNGEVLEQEHKTSFRTELPKAMGVRVYTWYSPRRPVHKVRFNYPVPSEDVGDHLYYKAGSERIPLRVVPAIRYYPLPDHLNAQDEQVALRFREAYRDQDKIRELDPDYFDKERTSWYVMPERALPVQWEAGSARYLQKIEKGWKNRDYRKKRRGDFYSLWVEPGLTTPGGALPGKQRSRVLSFAVFPEFRLLGLSCYLRGEDKGNKKLTADELTREADHPECSPQRPIWLSFTVPFSSETLAQAATFNPALDSGDPEREPWENVRSKLGTGSTYYLGYSYSQRLPVQLSPRQQYRLSWAPDKIIDVFGRRLKNPEERFFRTGHLRPYFEPQYDVALLEDGVDSFVGAWITNIKNIKYRFYGRNLAGGSDKVPSEAEGAEETKQGSLYVQQLPGHEGVRYLQKLRFREFLKDQSGYMSGKLNATSLFEDDPYSGYDEFFVQTTRFNVLAKIGYFRSMVWVTDMQTGEPVEGVKVGFRDLPGHSDVKRYAVTKKLNLEPVVTDENGMAHFDGPGTSKDKKDELWDVEALVLEKGDQIALQPLTRHFRIGSGERYFSKTHRYLDAWGYTAQGVYKLGDEVQFKFYLRDQDNKGLVKTDDAKISVHVRGPTNTKVYSSENIQINKFGSFADKFTVSENATSGWYQATVKVDTGARTYGFQPFRFLVTDFNPASFSVSSYIDTKIIEPEETFTHTTEARLLSGGPYKDAKVRLQGEIRAIPFKPDNPALKEFRFHSRGYSGTKKSFLDGKWPLDEQGDYQREVTVSPDKIKYGRVKIESAIQDDRGKNIAATTSALYSASDRWVGIKKDQWFHRTGEQAEFQIMVVDNAGEIVSGEKVEVDIQQRKATDVKVKGPGNAYVSKQHWSWVDVANCKLVSARTPNTCMFEPEEPGRIRVIARVEDSSGQQNKTTIRSWVTGNGYVSWADDDTQELEIIPESGDVEVGGEARYLVKNPFPGAKALVTVERYGVLESWVQPLEGGLPVIKVPVKQEYSPGYYLSVKVFSPRVDKPLKDGHVDLGKPTQRLGVVKQEVTDPYYKTEVDVATEKDEYRPGETVKARVELSGADLSFPHDNELSVVVIDEAVFQLNTAGYRYYDLYKGFYNLEERGVGEYSLLRRLIGRQDIDKKGANPGGGGGGGDAPEAEVRGKFKYIAYWNPSLKVTGDRAEFEFDLPDNLTQYRVFVLSADQDKRLGSGNATFRVNQPLEIKPAMANQLTEGDRFTGRFTVMNRTETPQSVEVDVQVDGPVAAGSDNDAGSVSRTLQLELPPYERVPVPVEIQTEGAGTLEFVIRASNERYADAMRHEVPVNKRSVLVTAANYGTTKQGTATENIQVPPDIYEGVGDISVTLSPTVIGNIAGAFEYMDRYPYLCWEQRLSKGLAAANYVNLKKRVPEVEWRGANGLAQEMLNQAGRFQAPNGGMTYWKPQNKRVSPYLSAYTAHGFNELRRHGYEIPAPVEYKLHRYLKRFLRRDIAPDYYSRNMASTVRAVALNALVEAGKADNSDVRRYRSHLANMTLFGRANYLEAALTVGNEDAVGDTINLLLSATDQTGGKFQFMESYSRDYAYMLHTPLRANCGILSGLVRAGAESVHGDKVGDIPFKLVRMITQARGANTHWQNTQENVFCMQALNDFASVYEREEPDFVARTRLDGEEMGRAAFNSFLDEPQTHSVPLEEGSAGTSSEMEVNKDGPGRLYFTTRLRYAEKEENAERINAGIQVGREYSVQRDGEWKSLESPMRLERGELVRVDLYVRLPAARHFVVVNDSVPGGLEPVNRDLATSSEHDANKANYQRSGSSWWHRYDDWSPYASTRWSFYHQEILHDSVRYYSDYLPEGRYHLSYVAQAIADGEFSVMPVKAEEMYDPDVFGLGLPMTLRVE